MHADQLSAGDVADHFAGDFERVIADTGAIHGHH